MCLLRRVRLLLAEKRSLHTPLDSTVELEVDSEICRVHCDGLFTKSSARPAAPGRVAEHFVNKSRM